MKLTQGGLIETIRKKNQGWTTYRARKIAGISIRGVNQIWKEYQITGEIPEIGRKNGRPKKPIEDWEIQTVKEAFAKYSVSASALMKVLSPTKITRCYFCGFLYTFATKSPKDFVGSV